MRTCPNDPCVQAKQEWFTVLQMNFIPATLFRKRVALVLGAVLLAGFAPPFSTPAKADFTYDVTITSGSSTYSLTNQTATGGSININTGEDSSGTFYNQGFYVAIQAQAKQSSTLGRLLDTSVTVDAVNNSTATIGTITVTLTVTGYTEPNVPEGTLTNSLSTQDVSPDSFTASLTGTVLNSSGGTEASNTPASIFSGDTEAPKAVSFFPLTDPYKLEQTTTFTNVVLQGSGESATLDETTQVTGPVPGALVLALTAFPVLLGVGWVRRKKLCQA
jgi:hypothetical protein